VPQKQRRNVEKRKIGKTRFIKKRKNVFTSMPQPTRGLRGVVSSYRSVWGGTLAENDFSAF